MHSILMSTVKVRANEQESNSFELLQRVQPKLCDEVTNSQQPLHMVVIVIVIVFVQPSVVRSSAANCQL